MPLNDLEVPFFGYLFFSAGKAFVMCYDFKKGKNSNKKGLFCNLR